MIADGVGGTCGVVPAVHGSDHPSVAEILDAAGVQGGLVVHLGCGDGKLTATLRATESFVVHGLDTNADNVARARRHIRSLGLYGPVSADRFDGRHLPYADNLVNLVVASGGCQAEREEVLRVLAPGGVALFLNRKSKIGDRKWTKPWPDEIDEWTHYLHAADNNAVAQDTRVGPPRHLQWKAGPLYCRSHETDPSVCAMVSAGGRIFYILDEGPIGIVDPRLPSRWILVARDAFNGVLLWKRPVPEWGWREWSPSWKSREWTRIKGARLQIPRTVPRRLVAVADKVYVTLGYRRPVSVLDAATGNLLQTLDATGGAEEILFNDGILVLSTATAEKTAQTRNGATDESRHVMAVRPKSGLVLWRQTTNAVAVQTLAAAHGRVVYHNTKELVCLDVLTGDELWRATCPAADNLRNATNATMLRNDVVFFLAGRGLTAFSTKTGKVLWDKAGHGQLVGGPALYLIDDLVWYGGAEQRFPARNTYRDLLPNGPVDTWVEKKGHDPLTGKVVRSVRAENLFSCGHHYRCYRSKATERYILWPKRGVEFLDLKGRNFDRCDWLRAPCRLGVMPSNGLLYVPPHQCFCYPGARIDGFNALAAERKSKSPEVKESKGETRLEKGPAYGKTGNRKSAIENPNAWPTFRRDSRRSGSSPTRVATDLQPAWERTVGGKLSAPVLADGKLFVASIDAQTVHCLDASDGQELWTHTTGGRVDSPPTICTFVVPPSGGPDEAGKNANQEPPKGGTTNSLCLFGSGDGWVYCLRAADGVLMWRFRAAPIHCSVVCFGQVESAWPVHGSVLVENGTAYFAAGRSSFLDGGIHVYGLDVETGDIRHHTQLEGPYPKLPDEKGRPHDMEGALPEVLVSQGGSIFMQQIQFNKRLERQETPRFTRMGDRKMGRHLFCTTSLLDDTWWNRSYWMYSGLWPGFYFGQAAPKSGQMLVFDDTRTYSVEVYNQPRHMFFPGKHNVRLVADDNDSEPVLKGEAANWDKGPGFSRARPPLWEIDVPVLVRALVLADDKLFAAGLPNVLDPEDPLAAFEGRKGGLLWAVSAADGNKLAEFALESPPVFDGLIAANGRLFVCALDGRVLCLGQKE